MRNEPFVRVASVSVVVMVLVGCAGSQNPIKLYNAGVEQYNQQEYAKAIGMFKWSLERGREFSLPLIGLAKCHLALAEEARKAQNHLAAFTDLEHALTWINRAIDADPGNTDAYRTKIAVLNARGEVEATVATAKRAAALAGPSPSTLIMLAQTHHALGDYDSAELALKQGVKACPDDLSLIIELARLYDKLGRHDLALTYYQRAYQIDRYYPNLLRRIAELRAQAAEEQARRDE